MGCRRLLCLLIIGCCNFICNSFQNNHPFRHRSEHVVAERRTPLSGEYNNLDKLLEDSPGVVAEPLSPEEERRLIQDLKENGPTELEIRMNLLGINNATLAGFAVALVLFSLNNVLGTGWLGDYFGMNDVMIDAPSHMMSVAQRKQMETMSKGVVINYKDIQDRLNVH